ANIEQHTHGTGPVAVVYTLNIPALNLPLAACRLPLETCSLQLASLQLAACSSPLLQKNTPCPTACG
ncbi:hypothetical protein M1B34_02535, partial [Pseudomonas sp. MAFF 302030]